MSPFPYTALAPLVRPLWAIAGATAWLRCDAETVMRMIENGRIEWAWNIGGTGSRREIRVWFASLIACKKALALAAHPPGCLLEAEQVIRHVIGHSRPLLSTGEIQALLNCDRNLVRRHLAAREYLCLTQVRGSTPGNQRRLVMRRSFEAFLRRRRIC